MLSRARALLRERSIAGDAARIYVLQFLALGVAFVSSIIVARTLGAAQKGVVDLFGVLVALILQLGLLGADGGLLYKLTGERISLARVHGTGIVLSLATGALAALAGVLALPLWRAVVPGLPDWAIVLAFALGPFLFYRLIWTNLMTGIGAPVLGYQLDFLLALGVLLVLIPLVALGRLSATWMIALTAASFLLAGLIALVAMLRRESRLAPSRRLAMSALGFGSFIYLGTIANALHFRVDQLMVDQALGTRAVGVYSVSVRIAELLFLFDSAIGAAGLREVTARPMRESWALTRRLTRVQLAISVAAGCALVALAPFVLPLLYGHQFRGAVVPTIVAVPGVIAWSSSKILSNMLTYKLGRVRLVAATSAAGLALNVALNALSLNLTGLGITGPALASTISYAFVAAAVLWIARRSVAEREHAEASARSAPSVASTIQTKDAGSR